MKKKKKLPNYFGFCWSIQTLKDNVELIKNRMNTRNSIRVTSIIRRNIPHSIHLFMNNFYLKCAALHMAIRCVANTKRNSTISVVIKMSWHSFGSSWESATNLFVIVMKFTRLRDFFESNNKSTMARINQLNKEWHFVRYDLMMVYKVVDNTFISDRFP